MSACEYRVINECMVDRRTGKDAALFHIMMSVVEDLTPWNR